MKYLLVCFVLASTYLAGCGGGSGLKTTPQLQTVALDSPAPSRGSPSPTPTNIATAAPSTSLGPTPGPIATTSSGAFVTRWGLELGVDQVCTANLSEAIALHATVIRVQYLPDLQPARCYDATYSAALRARLTVVWITPGVDLNSPVDTTAYAQQMAAAAAAHPGGIWEIINEPDVVHPKLDRDWPNQQLAANEYVALAQATAIAIHAADGDALVVSGGPSGIEASTRTLPWLHATANLAPLLDGVAFHPYAGFDADQFASVKALYKKPVFITEWETADGGIISGVLRAYKANVPLFVYCAQACAQSAAIPIFP